MRGQVYFCILRWDLYVSFGFLYVLFATIKFGVVGQEIRVLYRCIVVSKTDAEN